MMFYRALIALPAMIMRNIEDIIDCNVFSLSVQVRAPWLILEVSVPGARVVPGSRGEGGSVIPRWVRGEGGSGV